MRDGLLLHPDVSAVTVDSRSVWEALSLQDIMVDMLPKLAKHVQLAMHLYSSEVLICSQHCQHVSSGDH